MSEYDPRQSPTKPTQTSSYAARQQQRRKQASSPLSTITSMPPSRLILIGAAVLLLVLLLGLLFGRGGGQTASTADNGTLATQGAGRITPGPTALPAAPVQTQAKVIRLGGGPGRLHETPLFDSATLSLTLKEGDTVIMMNKTKKDAAGNSWALVSSGDYVGWIPATNLDTGTTPASTTPTPTS